MRDPYCQELQRVKRQNQELKNAFDMSMRDYKLACDARNHAQGQLNLVKTELDSLKVGDSGWMYVCVKLNYRKLYETVTLCHLEKKLHSVTRFLSLEITPIQWAKMIAHCGKSAQNKTGILYSCLKFMLVT